MCMLAAALICWVRSFVSSPCHAESGKAGAAALKDGPSMELEEYEAKLTMVSQHVRAENVEGVLEACTSVCASLAA